MATFEVTGPDGAKYQVTAPEGASDADVMGYVRAQMGQAGAASAPPAPPAAAAPTGKPLSTLDKIGMGIMDPIHGGAQLLTHALPDSVVDAGNSLNNWLADKTGLVAHLPERNVSSLVTGQPTGVDALVQRREQDYQRQRAAAGEDGIDWWRIGGNAISPANLAVASRVPAAASLFGRVVGGGAAGAATSALNPVTGSGDYWDEKGSQVGAGAAFGGATPFATGALARLVSPRASTNSQLQLLRDEGVRPTLGQTLGGMWNSVEEKLTSLPVVGDAIASARRGAAGDLDRAAMNRALAPINQRLPEGLTGREAVQHVEDTISRGYEQLLPRLSLQADQQLTSGLTRLRTMVANGAIDPRAADSFERILQNDVLAKFGGQNMAMTGQTFKRVESDLNQQISRLAGSTDADQRLVGDALSTVRQEMRQALTRSNPQHAVRLGDLNTAWANFKRVQRAAAGLGADEGIFTPAQLQGAVKALDRSKDKARFAEGKALMQDLSEAGKSVLGSKVPDSGTAGRLFLGGGLSLFDPTLIAPISLAAGASMYLRPVQNLLTGAVARRPQAAQAVADSLRQASPYLVPLGVQMGASLLE